jgi:minor extracellular serine protease Vpr
LRRAVTLLACCAALAAAVPAGAQLEPLHQHVAPGTITLHRGPAEVRVIAALAPPPLAQAYGRGLYGTGARRRLAVHGAVARAYVARLAAAQARAVAELHAAIPQARVQERFRLLLDAVTVQLPAPKLPRLLALRPFTRVYPSLGYRLALDRSPAIIGADAVHEQLGADGTGVKIAVVDDGIDQTNPFFDPKGLSYPPGFPKGNTAYTTPKVIVARSFPGPNAGRAGSLPLDPEESFHGTHVAGIAAGVAGTTAPAGADHPEVGGLSGVAPRAWLGNYRVFTVPTPIGNVANTPEIVEALEAAVADGMDVINFSGGGAETDPANDALIQAVHNVAAAGVVPVISAGNDRDDLGDGTVGSPGTAPDAIAVGAVSNVHVFAPPLDVTVQGAPASLKGIPFQPASGAVVPPLWSDRDQTLVDVSTVTGTDGEPVDPHLCGPQGNVASVKGTLPRRSLAGAIALVARGICPLVTKGREAQAAGATGVIVIDNRQGETEPLPTKLAVPSGTISNLDGADLRAYLEGTGGRTRIRVGSDVAELPTGRSGVVTSFSASGPTPFGHDLKPDLSAPGGQILSSTLPAVDSSRFAVFDGTSMAAPHVSGGAALLLQLHPGWTPAEVKSALVSTAGPAWYDTARTQEAPVPLEGGGLVSLPAATDPLLFTAPTSLSFENLDATRGATSKQLLVRLSDAGGGAGSWAITVAAQAATAGASVDVAGTVAIPPGGDADVAVTASAAADAARGENYGFLVLRRGSVTRRVPYLFLVERPALASAPVLPLRTRVSGSTRPGTNRVSAYRYPTAPFGNAPDTPAMEEDGGEVLYSTTLAGRLVNAGVSILTTPPGARADPFYLGAKDESTVQGDAGTPVDVNELTSDYLVPIGAAGVSFPSPGTFYVAVDSPRDRFSGRLLAGRYVLRSWVNDVTPPTVRLLTGRVSTGRPTLAIRTLDPQAGVDPNSLELGYRGVTVSASGYDPLTGVATFRLPRTAPALAAGTLHLRLASSDYQEAKNVNTIGSKIEPNTRTAAATVRVVRGPAVDWLEPSTGVCAARAQTLLVAAGAPDGIASVRVLLDGRPLASARRRGDGVWTAMWRRPARARHVLEAVARDRSGRDARARVTVRSCDP